MTAAFCTQNPAAGRPVSVNTKNLSLIGIGVCVSIGVGIRICVRICVRIGVGIRICIRVSVRVGIRIRVSICVGIRICVRISLCSAEDVLLFGFLRGLGHLLFILFCFIVLSINLGLVNLNRVFGWHYIIRGRFSL